MSGLVDCKEGLWSSFLATFVFLSVSFNDAVMLELGYVSSVTDGRVWSNGGMILADGSTCTGRKPYHSASLSTKNPTLIGRDRTWASAVRRR